MDVQMSQYEWRMANEGSHDKLLFHSAFGIRTSSFCSYKALHGFEHAFVDLKLLLQPSDFQDFAVGEVAGGDLEVPLQLAEGFVGVEDRFQAGTFHRFGAVQVEHHIGT